MKTADHDHKASHPIAAWLLLLTMGGTQISFNLYHAFHSGHLGNEFLSVLFGVVPITAASIASHLASRRHTDNWIQGGAWTVTILAMALSIGATATVVDHGPGLWDAVGFGALLDVASLFALRVILRAARVAAEETDALAAAERMKAEAAALVKSARAEAGKLAAAAREEAAETVRLERERTARTEEDLAGVRAELDRVRAELERAREAVLKGGPRGRSTGPRRPARTAPAGGPKTAPVTGPADDVDDVSMEARMLAVLADNPQLKGKALADELGVSPGYARKLRRRLELPDRPQEPAGDRPQDRPEDRAEDRAQDRPDPVSQDRPDGNV